MKTRQRQAVDDLFRLSSIVAEAVIAMNAKIELEVIKFNTYHFQFLFAGVLSDLGVFALTSDDYPIRRWLSREEWADGHDAKLFLGRRYLEDHFNWIVSHPESTLVSLIASTLE